MFPDANLTSRTVGLLAAGSGVYMLALACAQAVIALGGHRDQAFGWLIGMIVLALTVWLVSDDLFLRVELALLFGSIAALVAMAGFLARRLRAVGNDEIEAGDIIEALHDVAVEA